MYNNENGETYMTWRELKNFIDKQESNILDKDVLIYNFEDGEEHPVDITDFLYTEDNGKIQSVWIPYLTMNSEIENDQTKKTSVS